jgi:hypothetical protein
MKENAKVAKSTVHIVVNRITLLAMVCATLGAGLIYKGFQSGELLIGAAITGLGSLGSILASPRTPSKDPVDVKVTNDPLVPSETIPTVEKKTEETTP